MRFGSFWQVPAALLILVGSAGVAHAADDPFALRVDLGLWSIIVFLGLFFLLKKFAWGPILHGLQEREETIRKAVEEAKIARADTIKAQAEFERLMAEEHAKIPKLMEDARRDAQALADEMRTHAQQEIQAERQRLRREIDMARDQALAQLNTHAAQLATLISAKAIKRELSEADHRRLVDEALVELHDEVDSRRGIV
ncbi:MAG: F0F1 ATP synthase subunit B [Gemmataceae bacterium]|nr:F0F1 ATP synthase subunit B [Gemmataceae bacterium]